jgi:hypothetical protein
LYRYREELMIPAMSAEMALEAGKDLTFEKVWASIERMGQRFEEMSAKTDAMMAKTDAQIAETNAQMARTDVQVEKMSKRVAAVTKLVGNMGISQGRLYEEMFSARVWDKFNAYGYEFTKGSRMRFKEHNVVLAEVDVFLENGQYAMAVEVKTTLSEYWVDDHLERMDKIRDYMNQHGDKRILLGAVAGGVVPENVQRYAEKHGLYVLIQNGENIFVAETPGTFKPREW